MEGVTVDPLHVDYNGDSKYWLRVPVYSPPFDPAELTDEEVNEKLTEFCKPMWDEYKVPVVSWDCEFYGMEFHPPPTIN